MIKGKVIQSKAQKFNLFITVILFILVIQEVNYINIILLGLFWLMVTSIGSFKMGLHFFTKSIQHHHLIKQPFVSLTFDDGPNPLFTPKVLELLEQYDAKASFFIVGKEAKAHPHLLQTIVAQGHTISNHSYEHSNYYGFWSKERIKQDIRQTKELLEQVSNQESLFFRPPFGVTNPNIAKAIKELNLKMIGWSIRSFDTLAKNPQKVVDKIEKKLKRGDIILLHDSSEVSVEILEKLLKLLQEKKLKSVTIETLLES